VVFHDLEFESLCTLRDALHTLLRDVLHAALVDDTPSVADVADIVAIYSIGTAEWVRSREGDEPTDVVMMLLSAVAVAIAWWTHRHMRPPVESIRTIVSSIDNGDAYLLPIPRSEPCFCDSGLRFKACHGRPPVANPA
jgi:SEC-C motif